MSRIKETHSPKHSSIFLPSLVITSTSSKSELSWNWLKSKCSRHCGLACLQRFWANEKKEGFTPLSLGGWVFFWARASVCSFSGL